MKSVTERQTNTLGLMLESLYCEVGGTDAYVRKWCVVVGRGSSVGIATRLRPGRSEDRIPVKARLSRPALGLLYLGTKSFTVVKRMGRVLDHPSHIASRLKKEQSYVATPGRYVQGPF
jgi:hypothetical protein